MVCNGKLETLVIDFETDASGAPMRMGDTPALLPGNITVHGKRRRNASDNDLVLFDTANPTGGDEDLRNPTEKLVLIINENNDKSIPDDNRKGGFITFTFPNLVHQVNSIRLLDIEEGQGNIQARCPTRPRRRRVSIPAKKQEQVVVVEPTDWYNIRKVRINLRGSGAVAALNLTVCNKEGKETNGEPMIDLGG